MTGSVRFRDWRIKAGSCGRNPAEPLERIGAEADRGKEENENEREGARDVRHQLAIACSIGPERNSGVDGENQGPEKQRSRLPAPERGDRVNLGEIGTRERRDVLDEAVVVEATG